MERYAGKDNKNIFGKNVSLRMKGMLVIMMFWSHLFAHPGRLWTGVEWVSMFSAHGTSIEVLLVPFFHVAVPLFFFIAGYGFKIKYGNDASIKAVINQLLGLYRKYWIAFFICVSIMIAIGVIDFNFKEFILNMVGLSSSYCGEWWFLATYVIIVLFAAVIPTRTGMKNIDYKNTCVASIMGGTIHCFVCDWLCFQSDLRQI